MDTRDRKGTYGSSALKESVRRRRRALRRMEWRLEREATVHPGATLGTKN